MMANLSKFNPNLGLAKENLNWPDVRLFEVYLTQARANSLAQELYQVIEKYYECARVDRELHNFADLKPISGVVAVMDFNLWRSVLWPE